MVESFGVPVARGEGFGALQRGLNMARVQTAARAVGLARAAVEDTTDYLQRRVQFGRPIGDFQALRFRLAEMAARVDQARAHYRQVATLMDHDVPCESEAAMVKLMATEMAAEVTGEAVQLHGGTGYTTEHQVERYWRDARLTTIFEGTSEIQRLIISDRMLGRARP
jgi:alkylation response protein AidB-like acyl-CoA dehydrogenase